VLHTEFSFVCENGIQQQAGPYNFGKQRWVLNLMQLNVISAAVLMNMKI